MCVYVCVRVCVCVCVCVFVCIDFQVKQTTLTFSAQNCLKNGFRVGNSEKYCRNKNPHPRYTMFANFHSKWKT